MEDSDERKNWAGRVSCWNGFIVEEGTRGCVAHRGWQEVPADGAQLTSRVVHLRHASGGGSSFLGLVHGSDCVCVMSHLQRTDWSWPRRRGPVTPSKVGQCTRSQPTRLNAARESATRGKPHFVPSLAAAARLGAFVGPRHRVSGFAGADTHSAVAAWMERAHAERPSPRRRTTQGSQETPHALRAAANAACNENTASPRTSESAAPTGQGARERVPAVSFSVARESVSHAACFARDTLAGCGNFIHAISCSSYFFVGLLKGE